jgi:hypothetical protein
MSCACAPRVRPCAAAGYGKSSGSPGEGSLKESAISAYTQFASYLTSQGAGTGSIVLLGRSLGGAAATWIAKAHTPKGLILQSTFANLKDVSANGFPLAGAVGVGARTRWQRPKGAGGGRGGGGAGGVWGVCGVGPRAGFHCV